MRRSPGDGRCLVPAASSGDDADAIALTDQVALVVAGGGVDLGEVVLDAARDSDQQPGGLAGSPDPVRAAAGRKTKLPAAASNASSPQRTESSPSST
jgi:hypothetical protein